MATGTVSNFQIAALGFSEMGVGQNFEHGNLCLTSQAVLQSFLRCSVREEQKHAQHAKHANHVAGGT